MDWGLLGGLGKGLNQAAGTINRGMNIDIQAKRQEESELRRQASIERRWQASEERAKRQEQAQSERWAKQDERQASQDARQLERDKVSDSQFAQNMKVREAQTIERNLSDIMEQASKAVAGIEKRYQKLSVDSLGQPLPKDQLDALMVEKEKEVEAVKNQYGSLVDNKVKSYGDKLRGTGFAYLLDIPDIKEGVPKSSDKGKAGGQEGSGVDDLASKILNGGAQPEVSFLDKAVGGGNATNADPTFAAGYARGLGGLYENSARPIDESDLSPIDSYKVSMGHMAGGIPGLLGDAGQIINDKAIQPAWDWLNTKPSERQ